MVKKLTIGSLKNSYLVSQASQTIENTPVAENALTNDEEDENLKVEQHGSVFSIKPEPNKSVLESALNQHMDLDYKCRQGTCGRCRVKVEDGDSLIYPVNEKEHNKLKEETQNGFRLACQAIFR